MEISYEKPLLLALLILTCALLFASFWVVLPARTAAADPILRASSSTYVSSIGTYHIVGEVHNVGSQALQYVKITAYFYSSNGTYVGSDYTFTVLSTLNSGDYSPFDLLFTDTAFVPQVDHYSLYYSYSDATAKPVGLKIISNSSYVDTYGYVHVDGVVQNVAAGNATYIKVVATFYGQAGSAVAEGYTYASPTTLQPNQLGLYNLTVYDNSRTVLVKSYVLTAQSQEYSLQSNTPTPSPTPTLTATPTPSPTATPTPSPSPSPTLSPTPTASPTPVPTPTATPSPTSTPSPTLTPTPTPTLSPTTNPTQTATSNPTTQPTLKPSNPTPTPTVQPSLTATSDPAPSPTIPEIPTVGLIITALVVASATVIILKKTNRMKR